MKLNSVKACYKTKLAKNAGYFNNRDRKRYTSLHSQFKVDVTH